MSLLHPEPAARGNRGLRRFPQRLQLGGSRATWQHELESVDEARR